MEYVGWVETVLQRADSIAGESAGGTIAWEGLYAKLQLDDTIESYSAMSHAIDDLVELGLIIVETQSGTTTPEGHAAAGAGVESLDERLSSSWEGAPVLDLAFLRNLVQYSEVQRNGYASYCLVDPRSIYEDLDLGTYPPTLEEIFQALRSRRLIRDEWMPPGSAFPVGIAPTFRGFRWNSLTQ